MPCCRAPAPWSGATAPGMPHCARRHRGPGAGARGEPRGARREGVRRRGHLFLNGHDESAMSSLAKVLGRLSGSGVPRAICDRRPLPHRRLLRRAPRSAGGRRLTTFGRRARVAPSVPWACRSPGCTPSSSPIRPRAPPPERSCSPSHRPRSPSSEPEPPSRSGPPARTPRRSADHELLVAEEPPQCHAGDDESQPGPLRRGRTHKPIGIDRPNTRGTLNDRSADPTTTCRGRRGETSRCPIVA